MEKRVTENGYNEGARNRKWLQWRIVKLWRLANDPLLLAPNDLSGEEPMETTVAESALVRWQ
jgi:hypothetical protein